MRGCNRFCNLSCDRECLWKRNWASRDPVRQRRAVHQFHRERMGPARIFEAVDPCDKRMVQRRKNLGLSVETGKPLRISRDQVRHVVEQAVRSPVEGDRKVLLLTEFHLVVDAAPILLKSVEAMRLTPRSELPA